jgi:hypothetical protein
MGQILGRWIDNGAITPSKLDATASYTMGNLVVSQDATISGSLDVVGSFAVGNLSASDGTFGVTSPIYLIYDGKVGIGTTPLVLFHVNGGEAIISGNVGIGTTNITENLDIYESMNPTTVALRTFSTNSSDTNTLKFNKSHGASSNVMTVDGEDLGAINAAGVNFLGYNENASVIKFTQDGAASSTKVPGRITLVTYTRTGTPHTLLMDSTGNVGIGTTSPSALFHVEGGNAIVSGNVGIGTINPASKLHVYGTASSASLNVSVQNTANDGDVGLLMYGGSGFSAPSLRLSMAGTAYPGTILSGLPGDSVAQLTAYNDNGLALYTYDAKPLYLGTNNTAYVTLSSSGKVGIGTTSGGGPVSPTENLDIYQVSAHNSLALRTFSATSGHTNALVFKKSHDPSSLIPTVDGEVLGFIQAWGVNSGNVPTQGAYITFKQRGASGTVSGSDILFNTSTSAGSSSVVIINAGNVGIGTTTPTENLDIYQSSDYNYLSLRTYSTTNSHSGALLLEKSHDASSPVQTVNGETLGKIIAKGMSSSNTSAVGAQISFVQNGSAGALVPTNIVFNPFSAAGPATITMESTGDLYSTKWADCSSTCGLVGLLPGWTGVVKTMRIGSLVYAKFNLLGTATGTDLNLTLPFGSDTEATFVGGFFTVNAGVNGIGYGDVETGGLLNLFPDAPSSSWTNDAGPRAAFGSFTYRTTPT